MLRCFLCCSASRSVSAFFLWRGGLWESCNSCGRCTTPWLLDKVLDAIREERGVNETLALRPPHPRRIAAARRRSLCRNRQHDTPENLPFRMRHATNCLWCLILPFEPDAACVRQRTLQLVRGYLATNKKKEASTGLELPWLPAPPLVWQFTQTALSSPARSAVLHQAFSVPNVRVSA